MSRVQIAIGWYTPEQWSEVQRIMEDKATETHAQWLLHAQDLEAKLKKEGLDLTRYPMDLGDFEIWCTRKGKRRDSASRAEYVVEKTRK